MEEDDVRAAAMEEEDVRAAGAAPDDINSSGWLTENDTNFFRWLCVVLHRKKSYLFTIILLQ